MVLTLAQLYLTKYMFNFILILYLNTTGCPLLKINPGRYLLDNCLPQASCMEQSPSWEANQFSAIQEIPLILWNPKVHCFFKRARRLSLTWARSIQSMSPSHFLKIQLNIVLPSMPKSCKWSLSLRFSHQIPVCTFPLLPMDYVPPSSHSSRFYHSNSIGWGIQIISS